MRGGLRARLRVGAALPMAFLYVRLADPNGRALAAGLAVAALGVMLRGAAAGHLRKHEGLVTSGPYAWIRHPLYLGSALLAAGFLVAGRSWTAAVLGAIYFGLLYLPAIGHEERMLRARHGRAHEEYATRVGLFWPRLAGPAPPSGAFSWTLYRRNGEYQATLGFLVGFALLWLKVHRGV